MGKIGQLIGFLSVDNFKKVAANVQRDGIGHTVSKIFSVCDTADSYGKWLIAHAPSDEDLKRQTEAELVRQPLISILVPVYHTPDNFLTEMVESVLCQTYGNWELILADANADGDARHFRNAVKDVASRDLRIRVVSLEKNGGISENTNAALYQAEGEYIALLDHDDLLTPDALYEMVCAINETDADYLYSDEDKTDEKNSRYFEPYFKSDFDMEFVRSYNYICHFSVLRRSLAVQVGGFHSEFDGAQDYDLVLRIAELSQGFVHVPKILYHWRVSANSTAASSDNKNYTNDAGKRALEAHFARCNISCAVEQFGARARYRVRYPLVKEDRVCVTIRAFSDTEKAEHLKREIEEITAYGNYEVVIAGEKPAENDAGNIAKNDGVTESVKNDGVTENAKNDGAMESVKNDAEIGNDADYVVSIDENLHVLSPAWLEDMLSYAEREDVDVVCPKICDANRQPRHMREIMNVEHIEDLPYDIELCKKSGYFDRQDCVLSLKTVMCECYMTRRGQAIDAEKLHIVYLPFVEMTGDE